MFIKEQFVEERNTFKSANNNKPSIDELSIEIRICIEAEHRRNFQLNVYNFHIFSRESSRQHLNTISI